MKRSHVAAFCAYVVLAASHWGALLVFPSSLSLSQSGVLVFGLVSVGAVLSARHFVWPPYPQVLRAITSGLFLFGLPSLLSGLSGGALPALTRVSMLALVPAGVVFIANQKEPGRRDFLSLLGASLAGLAGAFLVLPSDLTLLLHAPTIVMNTVALIVFIAIGSYMGHASITRLPLRTSLLLMVVPSFVLMALVGGITGSLAVLPGRNDVALTIWSAIELVLVVYLIGVIPPVSLSTRYLFVPLVTTLEGAALIRPGFSWRLAFGLLLLIFGSVSLFLHSYEEADSSMSLL